MLYMRDDLNANKTIVFMVSTNIYIYLWWLVTATSTDLSHHLKYFYCVYFDGRPSNSCVIHLAGQDVLYLMPYQHNRSSVFEIEIQGADMYFTNNSDNNVQTTSV